MAANISPQADHNFVSQLIDRGKVSRTQVSVVFLCLIFSMLDGFDITAMAVTADVIGKDMQLAEDKLGIVFSSSLAGMMFGAMFLASLSDIFGRRTLIIATLLVVGGSVLLTAYVDQLWQLIILRFISGLGAGAMLASQATLASEYSPEKYRALSVTIVTAGYPLGAMMTGVVAGSILPQFGWQGMFIAGGVVTIAMALLAYVFLPESLQFLADRKPKNALQKFNKILRKFSVEPLDEFPDSSSDTQSTNAQKQKKNIVENMLALIAPEYRKTTLILWSAFFMTFFTLYFLMSWTPKLLINAGFSSQMASYAFSSLNLGGVIGILTLGVMTTRWKLSTVIGFFLVSSAVGMWVFSAFSGTESVIISLIFMIGLLVSGGFCGLYAAAAKLYPSDIRSTGVGWGVGLGRSGAVVAPLVAGFMIAAGIDIATNFLFFSFPVLVGGILAFLLRVR